MTMRKDGAMIKNSKPPVAQLLVNRIHAWQVKPELLEEHPSWFDGKRVARSGVLWGDSEDPPEEKPKKRQSGGDIDEQSNKRKKDENQERKDRIIKADEKLKRLIGDDSINDIFDA